MFPCRDMYYVVIIVLLPFIYTRASAFVNLTFARPGKYNYPLQLIYPWYCFDLIIRIVYTSRDISTPRNANFIPKISDGGFT